MVARNLAGDLLPSFCSRLRRPAALKMGCISVFDRADAPLQAPLAETQGE